LIVPPMFPQNPAYGLAMFGGIILSAVIWSRRFHDRSEMTVPYVFGLLGALVGAKLTFVIVEWHVHFGRPDFWYQMLYGKTVLGALLGGYGGVEAGKKLINMREATGDTFAVIVPLGLALGRIGCWLHGCCLGRVCEPRWYAINDAAGAARYPVAPVEITFHLLAALTLWWMHRRGAWRGQLFHVYLMGYGLFRIAHETVRDTPRVGPVSVYQIVAAAVVLFAAWRFRTRASPGDVGDMPD
jgi:phosphatidylglycerol:prolipoprotein diacylglycerol transferase